MERCVGARADRILRAVFVPIASSRSTCYLRHHVGFFAAVFGLHTRALGHPHGFGPGRERLNAVLGALRDELWKLQCRVNRRWPLQPRAVPPAAFIARGHSSDVKSAAASKPELCIVLTTHKRPEACASMLVALNATLAEAERADPAADQGVFVLVLNDPSDRDYAPVLAQLAELFPGRFAFHEASHWLGKPRFWAVFQHAFDVLAQLRTAHVLFLQDDLSFAPSFIRDMRALWRQIEDRDKIALYLLAMPDDEPRGRWIEHDRELNANGQWARTQWHDLSAFYVSRRYLELLRYEVFPLRADRWKRNPARSSGVGEQFTRRLFGRGNIYQVGKTFVFHGSAETVMNPEARAARRMDNRPGGAGEGR